MFTKKEPPFAFLFPVFKKTNLKLLFLKTRNTKEKGRGRERKTKRKETEKKQNISDRSRIVFRQNDRHKQEVSKCRAVIIFFFNFSFK